MMLALIKYNRYALEKNDSVSVWDNGWNFACNNPFVYLIVFFMSH